MKNGASLFRAGTVARTKHTVERSREPDQATDAQAHTTQVRTKY